MAATAMFEGLVVDQRGNASPIKYVGQDGEDVSDRVVNPAGFVKVDGIYGLPYDRLVALVMVLGGALAGWAGFLETSASLNRPQGTVAMNRARASGVSS